MVLDLSTLRETEQTTKQPVVFMCRNPECKESKFDIQKFEFESDYPECPKCGSKPPTVQKRALIHYLSRDPMGEVQGNKGLRYRLGCDGHRVDLATERNGEAATDQAKLVNCPGCLKFLTTTR